MSSRDIVLAAAGASGPVTYIEDVFSTYLYTGNGSTQTITNGIDLAGKGGLVWGKSRNSSTYSHQLYDTNRGATNALATNNSNAQASGVADGLTAFLSNGFSLGATVGINANGSPEASWTFRKQPKFFDVQTVSHTNGTANTIDLSGLGTVGCVIAKITTTTGDWTVWHKDLTAGNNIQLNTTAAQSTTNAWLSVSGTTATLASAAPTGTYVIYAYAHNAGGFGLTGTDNVISCGSYLTDSSGVSDVTLGYEPQWLLYKPADNTGDWRLIDSMRGWSNPGTGADRRLVANTSAAETSGINSWPTATGFRAAGLIDTTYIYIAIRRGPMKVPTDATKVFKPDYWYNTDNRVVGYLGHPADLWISGYRTGGVTSFPIDRDRLRGGEYLTTSSTSAGTATAGSFWDNQLGYLQQQTEQSLDTTFISWTFRRAPGFFDEVCFTGTGANMTIPHNLTVAPELIIFKTRSDVNNWIVCLPITGADNYMVLNLTNSMGNGGGVILGNGSSYIAPTALNVYLATPSAINLAGTTVVSYLFASCPGVSKVGIYTGTGATQTINCGFTGGARFVLIKRIDSTGNWYVWDTARGMVAGTDPKLALNSTAAETNANWVYTTTGGFQIVTTDASVNANGGSYIFLAVA